MIRKLLTCALALVHLGVSAQALPNTPPPTERKFHFVVPTRHPSHVPQRASPFKLEFRNSSLDRFGELLVQCKNDNMLPDFEQQPPTLHVYVPTKEIYTEHRDRIAGDARRQWDLAYPGKELRIEMHVIKTQIKAVYMYEKAKALLAKAKEFANKQGDAEGKQWIAELERANAESFAATRARFYSAGFAKKFKTTFAASRAFVVAGTRTYQTLPSLMQGGVPMTASLALIVMDAAAEFFLVDRSQRMQLFFARFPKVNTPWPKVNAAGSDFTNMAWNMALFSIGRPMLMQTIQHLAQPTEIDLPSWDVVLGILPWSIPGALIFRLFNKGYTLLADKGYVSRAQIDMGLQFPGLQDSANSIVSSNPEWYWLRPFINFPQWAIYIAVGVLGLRLPRKADRIIAVDTEITSWDADIHPEQLTDASYLVETDEDYVKALGTFGAPHGKVLKAVESADAEDCSEMILKKTDSKGVTTDAPEDAA